MRGQAGFFDIDERLKRLSDLGDQLEAFAGAVDFEVFRADLTKALSYSDHRSRYPRPRGQLRNPICRQADRRPR
jgi:hypothetical protein